VLALPADQGQLFVASQAPQVVPSPLTVQGVVLRKALLQQTKAQAFTRACEEVVEATPQTAVRAIQSKSFLISGLLSGC
jgi:hypothetical protein